MSEPVCMLNSTSLATRKTVTTDCPRMSDRVSLFPRLLTWVLEHGVAGQD